MKAKLVSLALFVASVVALGACKDPTAISASFATYTDTLDLFALNGTPLSVPTSLIFVSGIPPTVQARRAETGASFDVAFDILGSGQAVIYPSVEVGIGGKTGVIKATQPFDAITSAPGTNYNDSTATPIAAGDVLLVRAAAAVCQSSLSPYIFSKIAIDSINYPDRHFFVHVTVDPNCGFKSFATGVPRS